MKAVAVIVLALLASLTLEASGACTADVGKSCEKYCPGAVQGTPCGSGGGYCNKNVDGLLVCHRCGYVPYPCCPGSAANSICGNPYPPFYQGFCKAGAAGTLSKCSVCGLAGQICCPNSADFAGSLRCYKDTKFVNGDGVTGNQLQCKTVNGVAKCVRCGALNQGCCPDSPRFAGSLRCYKDSTTQKQLTCKTVSGVQKCVL